MRNLGWKRTATGYAQHKFHLGRDEAKARLASLRLEQLWKEVTARWERAGPDPLAAGRHVGTVLVMVPNPAPKSHTTPGSVLPAPYGDRVAVELPADTPAVERPVWDEVTLAVAEAVRKGEPVARVKPPPALAAMRPESWLVGDWHDQLQRDITVIKIELEEADAGQAADGAIQKEGQRLVEMGRRMIHRKAGGETLHAALAAYGRSVEGKYLDADRRVTPWGRTQGRQVAFLTAVLPNTPLSALDTRGVDDLLEVLRLRPAGKAGTAVSVSWTRNVIKQFRHFLRWLSRSDEFAWKRPADLEFSQVRIPLSPGEKGRAARSTQVTTYTPAELKTLNEYATPFERLLLLLALNCGFGRAELASMEVGEVLLHCPHPRPREVGLDPAEAGSWVLRVRHKSGVYGW